MYPIGKATALNAVQRLKATKCRLYMYLFMYLNDLEMRKVMVEQGVVSPYLIGFASAADLGKFSGRFRFNFKVFG